MTFIVLRVFEHASQHIKVCARRRVDLQSSSLQSGDSEPLK